MSTGVQAAVSVAPSANPETARLLDPASVAADSRRLLEVSAPIIMSQLGAIGMSTMDTIMVGPLGADSLAAVGLASSLHWSILVVTTGTLFGMGPIVSQAFGAGDLARCRAALIQGLWLALALSVPVIAVNRIGEPLALMLGQEPGISATAGEYMAALAWGVVPMLLFVALRQYLEGMSATRPAMVITFVGLGVNFIGNLAFIYGRWGWVDPMGAVGSGWSTTLVRWAMFLAMLLYVLRVRAGGISGAPSLRLDRPLIRRIVGIGLPTGAQIGMEVGLFTFAAVMMGWFGATELGTHQVTINLAATTFMVAMGFSLAGSIGVGQRIGANDPVGTRRVVVLTYLFVSTSMACFALLFWAAPETLLRLYTGDPAVIELGAGLLLVAAFFQIFDGAQAAGFAVLRGAADTRIPMFIAIGAYWGVGAPAAYALGFHTSLGPIGVWAGLVLGIVAATVLLGWRVWIIHWKSSGGELQLTDS